MSGNSNFAAKRLYLIIQNYFGGNFHVQDIPTIVNLLDTSYSNIYKLFRQLTALGLFEKTTNLWGHNISWKTRKALKQQEIKELAMSDEEEMMREWENWKNEKNQQRIKIEECGEGNEKIIFEIYNSTKKEVIQNKITKKHYNNSKIEIDMEKLIAKDGLKYLKSLYYSFLYKRAWKTARHNRIKESKGNKFKRPDNRSKGYFEEVSASFVKSINTDCEVTEKTILKHLKRGKEFGLIDYKNQYEIISFDSYQERQSYYLFAINDEEKHLWQFSYSNNSSLKGTNNSKLFGKFSLYKFLPNLVCPLF